MAQKKSLNKENRTLILRIIALLLLVGIVMPLLNVLVVQGPGWPSRIDFLFHIQQPYMIAGLIIIIFAYLAWSKRPEKQEERAAPRLVLGLLAAALFCLVLWSHLQFFTALDAGAIRLTESEILYDSAGFLGVRFPRESTQIGGPAVVRDAVVLADIPQDPELKGIVSWNTMEQGAESRLLLSVNGHSYDLSDVVLTKPEWTTFTFTVPLEPNHLKQGENVLEFSTDNTTGAVMTFARQMYYPTKSAVSYDSGTTWEGADGKLLVWIRDSGAVSEGFTATAQRGNALQLLLFRIRSFLIFFTAIALFLGIMGLRRSAAWLKAAELEAYSSVLLSLLMLQFVEIVKSHWLLLSTLVVGAVGRILGVFYGEGVQYVTTGVNCPVLRLLDMTVLICKSSSGVESAGYFTMLFLLVLVTNWKELNRVKMLLFYALGLAGAVLVNIIRITLLLLVGVYVSQEFSMGVFHTNVGWILFLAYSAVYWYALLPFVRKKK